MGCAQPCCILAPAALSGAAANASRGPGGGWRGGRPQTPTCHFPTLNEACQASGTMWRVNINSAVQATLKETIGTFLHNREVIISKNIYMCSTLRYWGSFEIVFGQSSPEEHYIFFVEKDETL